MMKYVLCGCLLLTPAAENQGGATLSSKTSTDQQTARQLDKLTKRQTDSQTDRNT